MHHSLAYRQADESIFLIEGVFCKTTLACVKLTKNNNNQHSHEETDFQPHRNSQETIN